jgi:hypothetical protein
LFQQAVEDLIIEDDVVKGVKTQMGLSFTADAGASAASVPACPPPITITE